jgi:hypothetical protein
MKVNISGKGVIPIINKVAPVYNVEVADAILKKIIKNPKFRVYASEGFGQVTAATLNAPVAPAVEAPKEAEPVKKVEEVPGVVKEIVVEEKAPVVEEVAIEEPAVEEAPVAEEIEQVEEPVELNEEVESEAIEEPVEEITEDEEITSEETTEEEAPVQQTSKKKKKNRK